MSQPSLRDALAAVQTLRASYMTSSEEALANLLVALAHEVEGLRRDLMVSLPAGAPSGSEPDQNVRAELEELRRRLATHEAIFIEQGFDPVKRRSKPIVDPPRTNRSVEYLAQNLPDLGDPLAPHQIQSHLSQPRVRPEDIQLTEEDLERQVSQPFSPPLEPLQNQTAITLVLLVAIFAVMAACLLL